MPFLKEKEIVLFSFYKKVTKYSKTKFNFYLVKFKSLVLAKPKLSNNFFFLVPSLIWNHFNPYRT